MWIQETQTQRNDKHTIIMANIRPSNGIKQITTTTSRENQQKKHHMQTRTYKNPVQN